MACENGYGYCKGPGSFGAKCTKCSAGASSSSSSALPTRPLPGKPAPIVAPSIITAPTSVSTTPLVAATRPAGYLFYRGDTRPPEDLRGGFKAWVPLSTAQARQLITRYMASTGTVDLPSQAAEFQRATNAAKALKLLDLVREIKKEKNRSTMHISTDLTDSCGGYTSGYIYEMAFTGLNTMDKSRAITNAPRTLECTSPINPIVVLDGTALDAAAVIALSSQGDEVSFLTGIPYTNFTRFKAPGTTVWQAMPV